MDKNKSIKRFIEAQKCYINVAKREITNGKKTTHWIWFIFPQMRGLGFSPNSYYYGISGIKEAKKYYNNRYLRHNMDDLVDLLMEVNDTSLEPIFAYDNKKVHSCMTLFYLATGKEQFKNVIDKFYDGILDDKTVCLLK